MRALRKQQLPARSHVKFASCIPSRPLCGFLPPLVHLQSWLPARSHVKEALDQRLQVHPSGESAAARLPL